MSVALALCVSAGLVFALAKSRWNYMRLPELPRTNREDQPDVTIVIPARNEEANIGGVVESLAPHCTIVVDDASTDATAPRAAAAGARVIRAPSLPQNWAGKPNACWAGALTATSEWILFVDADTRYSPGFVESLIHYAERESLDMVSVFPRQQYETLAEKMLMPYAFALYFCGVNARNVNGSASREALANGQCLLFRRPAYFRFGGHSAVMVSIVEDVELARVAKLHGLRTRVLRGEHLASVRMYTGLGAIVRGFQKNSVRFLLVNPLTGLQVVMASILLTSYIPVLALLLRDGHWLGGACFAAIPAAALMPWYSSGRRALLAPLAIYPFQLVVLQALANQITGRKTVWKDRPV